VFLGGVAEDWGLSNVTLRPLVNSDLRFEGLSNPRNLGNFDCEDEDKMILRNSGSMYDSSRFNVPENSNIQCVLSFVQFVLNCVCMFVDTLKHIALHI
jgi:hypothetical protein